MEVARSVCATSVPRAQAPCPQHHALVILRGSSMIMAFIRENNVDHQLPKNFSSEEILNRPVSDYRKLLSVCRLTIACTCHSSDAIRLPSTTFRHPVHIPGTNLAKRPIIKNSHPESRNESSPVGKRTCFHTSLQSHFHQNQTTFLNLDTNQLMQYDEYKVLSRYNSITLSIHVY